MTFDEMVSPHKVTDLSFAHSFASAMVVEGESRKFAEIVSWESVNNLLEFGNLSFPRVRLLGTQEIQPDQFCPVGNNGYPRLSVMAVNKALREGGTLVAEGIEQLHSPVSLLSRYKSNKISWLAESIKLSCESDG